MLFQAMMPSYFSMAPLSLLLSLLVSASNVYATPVSDPLVKRSLSCNGNASDGTTYTTASHSYEIHCATDYYGGDLSSTTTASFEDCLSACDAATGCLAVAYVSGACYLKGQVNAPTTNSGVWGAKRTDAPAGGPSCVNSQSNGQQYTASSGTVFDIICGVDYYGGDLSSLSTATFGACIEACAANAQCVDVSYTGTSCYLKSVLKSPVSASHVWTAKLHLANSGTTTSTTPLSSATSTTLIPSGTTTKTTTTVSSTTTTTTPSATVPTTTMITTTTTTTTSATTTTTSIDPYANIVYNYDFEYNNGYGWYWDGNSGPLSGSFSSGSAAYSGKEYAVLTQNVYGNSGTYTLCLHGQSYIPSKGTYTLSFYIGRLVASPSFHDSIYYSVTYADQTNIATGNVCGAYTACPLGNYQQVNATFTMAQDGVQFLSICGTYSTPHRGASDVMIVDKVGVYGPN